MKRRGARKRRCSKVSNPNALLDYWRRSIESCMDG
jgi:hypothetical protein